jgi:hypothetical protein
MIELIYKQLNNYECASLDIFYDAAYFFWRI